MGFFNKILALINKPAQVGATDTPKEAVKDTAQNIAKDASAFIDISVDYSPDFPKYPNEDTDIPADIYIYDSNDNFSKRSDGQPLNNADYAYLTRQGYKNAKLTMQKSSNPKFHRTTAEEELRFQFFYHHGAESQKRCDAFHDFAYQAYKTDVIEEKIILLQKCIEAYESAKEWHYKKSKGAKLWFQDEWEHCHNSQNECFSWIDDEYTYLDHLIKTLDVVIPWILENSQKGFLQTDIYKAFPDEKQSDLRNTITYLANQNKVLKTKKGSTYFVCTTEAANEADHKDSGESKIFTTRDEIQAFFIIRGILAGVIDVENIVYRDTESYFGILYKDNNRKPICRLNLDTKRMQLLLPDEDKKFERIYINSLNDIYAYRDRLIEIALRYTDKNK